MTITEITQANKGAQYPVEFINRDGSVSIGHIVYYPAQNPVEFNKAEVYIDGQYHQFPIEYINLRLEVEKI